MLEIFAIVFNEDIALFFLIIFPFHKYLSYCFLILPAYLFTSGSNFIIFIFGFCLLLFQNGLKCKLMHKMVDIGRLSRMLMKYQIFLCIFPPSFSSVF